MERKMAKKVILLLIDSLMHETLKQVMEQGEAPALRFFRDRGRYWKEAVTLFPTMTASVDSSLVTGVYPDQHNVPGLIWFDPVQREVVNYINCWQSVIKIGIKKTADNLLHQLNEVHLSRQVTTIFEDLEQRGIPSAAINAVVHRGSTPHPIRLPFLLRLLLGREMEGLVYGPERMTLGSLIPQEFHGRLSFWVKGPFRRYGINDEYAVEATRYFLSQPSSPRFFFVYLPDHDHRVHRVTPKRAIQSLRRVDTKLQRILNLFPSWEEALKETVFILLGDHGQTKIGKEKNHQIDLDRLLSQFRLLPVGKKATDEDLVIANNERMAYLYPLKDGVMQRLQRVLSHEKEIDLVAWKEEGGVRVTKGGDYRSFFFKPEGEWLDSYGKRWAVQGDFFPEMLRIEEGRIQFPEYPDLFSRLYGALYAQDIPVLVITASPGHELKNKDYPTHLGGASHGSLHRIDSYVPLIIAGTDLPYPDEGYPYADHPRLLVLKEYILRLLSPSS